MDLYHYTWFECVSSYGADLADKTFLGLQKFDDNIRTYYQFDSDDATRFLTDLFRSTNRQSINLRAVRERKYVNKLNKTDAINYVF